MINFSKALQLFYLMKTYISLKLYQMIFDLKLSGRQIFHSGFRLYSSSNNVVIRIGDVRAREDFKIQMEGNSYLRIDNGVFFNNHCSINVLKEVRIGSNTIFGENVKIYDHNHIYQNPDMLIKDQGFTMETVVIGDNCWIGSNVIILKGVRIGDNVVIGANCIIYKNIENNSLVMNKSELLIKNLYENLAQKK